MAKPVQTMYFAVKLIASRVGDKRMLADTSASTGSMSATTHRCDIAPSPQNAGVTSLRIGPGSAKTLPGVAGHFASAILDFSDAEDRKCKTAAEAEQLVKKNYKAWLADAYDWFIVPATLEGGGTPPAAAGKARKPGGK